MEAFSERLLNFSTVSSADSDEIEAGRDAMYGERASTHEEESKSCVEAREEARDATYAKTSMLSSDPF